MWYLLILSLIVSSSSIDSLYSAAQPSVEKRSDENEPWKNPYLPDTVEPKRYHMSYTLNFDSNKPDFSGSVDIHVNILKRTNTFIVHSKNLNITDHVVYVADDHDQPTKPLSRSFYYPENDYFVMQTVEPLSGIAILHFKFNGNMTLATSNSVFNCTGMYSIPYTKANGEVGYLFTTDFGPSNSRNAFPNFDEPRFKAAFKLSFAHLKIYTALSSMPVEKHETDYGESHTTIFKMTPRISSYQFVFALTDFPFKTITVNGTQYRIWAQETSLGEVDYALKMTASIQSYLNRELDLPYPQETLDQIAIPGEVQTCKRDDYESAPRLVSSSNDQSKKGGESAKYTTLRRVAHSLAHYYFGNLVTCRYWNHAWLNEGLATFHEVYAVTNVDSSFAHRDHVFGVNLESSMYVDAFNLDGALIPANGARPRYDFILKEKGAAILNMVESFIGYEAFRSGIRRYLKKHKEDTVVTDDLWNALQQEVGDGLDIKTIMKDWVEMSGIPVIHVELLDDGSIKATQKQFLLNPIATADPTKKWYVPLTYRTKGDDIVVTWMNKTDAVFEPCLGPSEDDWIEFNTDRTGYYRVNYDMILLDRIAKQLIKDHRVFSELSRTTFISDALALAGAQQIGYDAFLSLTKYASKERALTPWIHIYNGFTEITKIRTANLVCCLQNYLFHLTRDVMEFLQVIDDGSTLNKEARPKIIALACGSGNQDCLKNVTRLFKAWIENEAIKADSMDFMREIYCFGLTASSNASEWMITFERYKRTTSKREKVDLLRALTCSRDVTLLESLLDYSLENSTEGMLRFDASVLIAANPFQSDCVWNWLRRKYADIDQVWGQGYAGNFLPVAVESFYTLERADELEKFLAVYRNASEINIQAAQTVVSRNLGWVDLNYHPIVDWIDENFVGKVIEDSEDENSEDEDSVGENFK